MWTTSLEIGRFELLRYFHYVYISLVYNIHCIHTHAHAHTCTHICANTHTDTPTPTHIPIHINAHTQTHIYTYTHTHIHTYTHTRIHAYTHTRTHTYTASHIEAPTDVEEHARNTDIKSHNAILTLYTFQQYPQNKLHAHNMLTFLPFFCY